MEGRIVLRDRHQALLQKVVDIGPGNVQRDIFRALLDARCSSIGPRRLAPDLGLAPAAVEQQLVDDEIAFDRPQRLVVMPMAAAGGLRSGAGADPSPKMRGYHRPAPAPFPCVAARLATAWRISGLVVSAACTASRSSTAYAGDAESSTAGPNIVQCLILISNILPFQVPPTRGPTPICQLAGCTAYGMKHPWSANIIVADAGKPPKPPVSQAGTAAPAWLASASAAASPSRP